jgi:metal-responsive CopG/Arc/MetJ family transcriptional regulator
MAKTFNVSFPQELVQEVDRTAKRESRSRSEVIREATRAYLNWWRDWEKLHRYGRQQARKLGIKESDVDRIVHEFRAEERQAAR